MAPVVNVKRFSRSKVDAPPPPPPPQSPVVTHEEDTDDNDIAPYSNNNNDDNGMFLDLGRSAWEDKERANEAAVVDNEQQKKMAKEEAKENAAMEKKLAALQKKAMAKASKPTSATTTTRGPAVADDDNGIFADQGSEILGRDKRLLITKIVQYRQLFPSELKTFKVKKNANAQELNDALMVMEVIVQTSSVDKYVVDSILATVKLVEGVSSYSSHVNISGLAEMLRLNPQFDHLIKQLFIKYNTFQNTPPESQLAILVISTAYVAVQNNKNRSKIESYLNEPVLP